MERNTDVSLCGEVVEVQLDNTRSLRTDDPHLQSAIRKPGISTAVSPLADVVEAIDEVNFRELTGSPQVGKKCVTLGVDIRCRMMRDLAGGVS